MQKYFLQSFKWVKRNWGPVQAENITDLINFSLHTALAFKIYLLINGTVVYSQNLNFFFFLFRIKTLSEQNFISYMFFVTTDVCGCVIWSLNGVVIVPWSADWPYEGYLGEFQHWHHSILLSHLILCIAQTLLLELLVWVWIGITGLGSLEFEQGHFHCDQFWSDNPKYYHIAAAVESPRRQEEDLAKNDLQKEMEFFSTFVMSQTTSPSSASC